MTGKYFHTDTFKVTEHNILCMLCCSKHARTHTHTHSHTRALLCTCMYVRTWHTHYLVLFLSLISLRLTQNDPIPSKIYIMHARMHTNIHTHAHKHTLYYYHYNDYKLSCLSYRNVPLNFLREISTILSSTLLSPPPKKTCARARTHTHTHTHNLLKTSFL